MNRTNNFLVPALVCCRPAIQRGLPGRHVHNFRVRTVTIPDMNLLSLILNPRELSTLGAKIHE